MNNSGYLLILEFIKIYLNGRWAVPEVIFVSMVLFWRQRTRHRSGIKYFWHIQRHFGEEAERVRLIGLHGLDAPLYHNWIFGEYDQQVLLVRNSLKLAIDSSFFNIFWLPLTALVYHTWKLQWLEGLKLAMQKSFLGRNQVSLQHHTIQWNSILQKCIYIFLMLNCYICIDHVIEHVQGRA